MSASANAAHVTSTERSAEATRSLCEALGIGFVPTTKLKVLATALAEVAAEEARRNLDFSGRVRALYEQLATPKNKPSSSASGSARRRAQRQVTPLVPLAEAGTVRFNPYLGCEPEKLLILYGREQLPAALNEYSSDHLKEAAQRIRAERPESKLRSKASRAAIIDYIVEHVAGPGY